jgi:hypothetical protein
MAIKQFKTAQVALTDTSGAIAFIKKMLEDCDLAGLSVKPSKNKSGGEITCIEVIGRLFEANDFQLDLYLEQKGNKRTVEFYIGEMPRLEFSANSNDFYGDLKKKANVSKVVKGLQKTSDAMDKMEQKTSEYRQFLLGLTAFFLELERNIER